MNINISYLEEDIYTKESTTSNNWKHCSIFVGHRLRFFTGFLHGIKKKKKSTSSPLPFVYFVQNASNTFIFLSKTFTCLFIYLDTIVLKTGKNNTSESAQ